MKAATSAKAETEQPAKGTCLREGCGKPVYQRGICKADYDIARRLVLKGEVTWDRLQAAGKVLAFQRTGPKCPARDWLLDGVETDKTGKAMSLLIEEEIGRGTPPLSIWENHLQGWTKAGATRAIRAALKRLTESGAEPVCRCGRPYKAPHDRAEGCGPSLRRQTSPSSQVDDIPPEIPIDRKPMQAAAAAQKPEKIKDAIRTGTPPDVIQGTYIASLKEVMDAAKAVRAEGHALVCRCGREWAHRGPCPGSQGAR